ncbi:hypothetical protein ACHAWX_004052 [Stephanocyclus meneghinianus]
MTSVTGDDDPPTETKETPESNDDTPFTSTSNRNGLKSPASIVLESTNDDPTQNDTPPAPVNQTDRSSDASQPSSKKRRSSIQINKDDHPEGECASDDEEGDDLNDEGGKRSDPFQRASAEVLKGRKILKASKKWSGSLNDGNSVRGTFANVNLVGSLGAAPAAFSEGNVDSKDDVTASSPATSAPVSTSIFGSTAKVPSFGSAVASSGFGKSTFGSGFGAVSNGFGAIKAAAPSSEEDKSEKDSPPKAFGQGFGSVSTGFGAVKSSSAAVSRFDSNEAESPDSVSPGAFAGGSSSSTPPAKKFIMHPAASVTNGEEDEDCVCEVRAKLFRMAPVAPEQETEATETNESVVPSVPSTAGRMELKKADDKQKEGTNDGSSGGKNEVVMDWHEAGIGPVRILKRKENSHAVAESDDSAQEKDRFTALARVVQRRETAPGSQGTKLILNVRLFPDLCRVHRKSEKCIQLDAPSSEGDGSGRTVGGYLFRVKTAAEADLLQTCLEKMLKP